MCPPILQLNCNQALHSGTLRDSTAQAQAELSQVSPASFTAGWSSEVGLLEAAEAALVMRHRR
jgi:hypothetical protein